MMKSQIILSFLLLTLVHFSCKSNRQEINTAVVVPDKFDHEWQQIQASKNKEQEIVAIDKFISAVYDDRRLDSTGIKYSLYHSYIDIKGKKRPFSDLFDKKGEDSLQTIVIEIDPSIENRVLEIQACKNWKPIDLHNLRYFMDR